MCFFCSARRLHSLRSRFAHFYRLFLVCCVIASAVFFLPPTLMLFICWFRSIVFMWRLQCVWWQNLYGPTSASGKRIFTIHFERLKFLTGNVLCGEKGCEKCSCKLVLALAVFDKCVIGESRLSARCSGNCCAGVDMQRARQALEANVLRLELSGIGALLAFLSNMFMFSQRIFHLDTAFWLAIVCTHDFRLFRIAAASERQKSDQKLAQRGEESEHALRFLCFYYVIYPICACGWFRCCWLSLIKLHTCAERQKKSR